MEREYRFRLVGEPLTPQHRLKAHLLKNLTAVLDFITPKYVGDFPMGFYPPEIAQHYLERKHLKELESEDEK